MDKLNKKPALPFRSPANTPTNPPAKGTIATQTPPVRPARSPEVKLTTTSQQVSTTTTTQTSTAAAMVKISPPTSPASSEKSLATRPIANPSAKGAVVAQAPKNTSVPSNTTSQTPPALPNRPETKQAAASSTSRFIGNVGNPPAKNITGTQTRPPLPSREAEVKVSTTPTQQAPASPTKSGANAHYVKLTQTGAPINAPQQPRSAQAPIAPIAKRSLPPTPAPVTTSVTTTTQARTGTPPTAEALAKTEAPIRTEVIARGVDKEAIKMELKMLQDALRNALFHDGDVERAKKMQTHGADVNEQDMMGNTMLHTTAEEGLIGILRLLSQLEIKPKHSIKNNEGFDAYNVAALMLSQGSEQLLPARREALPLLAVLDRSEKEKEKAIQAEKGKTVVQITPDILKVEDKELYLIGHVLRTIVQPSNKFANTRIARYTSTGFIDMGYVPTISEEDLKAIREGNYYYLKDLTKEVTPYSNNQSIDVGAIVIGTTNRREAGKLRQKYNPGV